ncbi:MAG: hypothetical protein ACI9YE_003699 [Psychroserpens sp.]
MGALVLGLVLIIGYYYQTNHTIRRLELVRSSGYHIYFKAGFAGFILLTISVAIWSIIDYFDLPSNFIDEYELKETIIFLSDTKRWMEIKVLVVFVLMFFISFIYVSIVRTYYYFRKNRLLVEITKIANVLEKFIISSTLNVSPVRIDLECGKVYVGLPEYPDLDGGELKYVTFLPLLSGYRNDKKDIVFSNNYYLHYQVKHDENDNDNDELNLDDVNDFKIVIPVKDIVVISGFSPDSYIQINEDNSSRLIKPDTANDAS